MQAIAPPAPSLSADFPRAVTKSLFVTLIDGQEIDIAAMSVPQLVQLQCEQEPAFAAAIARSVKDSAERAEVTCLAYTTICSILDQISQREQRKSDFSMGMDPRYSELILRLLNKQSKNASASGLFEVGFSSGVLLRTVAEQGFSVGGIEVVEDLFDQAKRKLEPQHHASLILGDFRKVDLSEHVGRYRVVYWNDVFEHIPTDEILDYLKLIYSLLDVGGQLVTITPNWHMRPSDVTVQFSPPRAEAKGFHLKEYTLREVYGLARAAGFRDVYAPTFISQRHIYASKSTSFTRTKMLLEPVLEWLPYRVAVQFCRRFGLNCTIAEK